MAEQPTPVNIEFTSRHKPDNCTGEVEVRTPPSDGFVHVHCQKPRHRGRHEFSALNPATEQMVEIRWTDPKS